MVQMLAVIVLAIVGSAAGMWTGTIYSNTTREKDISAPNNGTGMPKEFLSPELFVTTLVARNAVVGYVVCRLVVVVDPSKAPVSLIDEETLLADLFYQVTFKNETSGIGNGGIPELTTQVDTMLQSFNRLAGSERYTGAYIQQIDIFDRDEVRHKIVEERFVGDETSNHDRSRDSKNDDH